MSVIYCHDCDRHYDEDMALECPGCGVSEDHSSPPRPNDPTLLAALERRAFVMSGPHLSGYRVVIGFNTEAEAFAAHHAISAAKGASHE